MYCIIVSGNLLINVLISLITRKKSYNIFCVGLFFTNTDLKMTVFETEGKLGKYRI